MKRILLTLMFAAILFPSVIVIAENSDNHFVDVSSDHWAVSTILNMVEVGYIAGYPDDTFRPSGEITRAEFTSILTRILDLKATGEQPFVDMEDHWAGHAVHAAAANEIVVVEEYGDSFAPNTPITRLEITKMIARALALHPEYKTYLQEFDSLYHGDLPFSDSIDFEKKDRSE